MCAICGRDPCHPGCPNAEEDEPVLSCSICGDGIYEGDEYFDSLNGAACLQCLMAMNGLDCLDLVGEGLSTAEKKI